MGDVNDTESFLDDLYHFANEEPVISTKRQTCQRCCRPLSVCWCPYLPREPIQLSTSVYVLQHPFEDNQCLRTGPMLYHSLPPGKCHIIRGKRFSPEKYPELASVMKAPNTILLYPGVDAIDICDLSHLPDGQDIGYNLVLLDGTWAQARGLYHQNAMVKWPQKVQINSGMISKYVIRTQPTDVCLSTVESAAVALSFLEKKPQIIDILTKPLEALCQFQLDHGAQKHQSKEYLIKNGLYKRKVKSSRIKDAH
ncbi:DTW domain-containing protein 2 [Acanthosepion pharaonis]|uniref:tRNA-uridine aminocarboxypropyltransferase n=1 Tax=Acanthosepion pharaonis TaxID=158019 RepID=A0A812D4B7_ACAPH|nr:DTW domain-containing protein 2 [Sepia pharaonis]